jgi:putative FmdB family regulatory protein
MIIDKILRAGANATQTFVPIMLAHARQAISTTEIYSGNQLPPKRLRKFLEIEHLMPIYEYECRKCKAHVEILQKITDKPLTKCRKCGGRLEKQWSPTSFQLKGSGWYMTDYAGKKADAAEEKKGGATEPATVGEKATTKETTAEKKSPATPASSSGSTGGD